MMFKNYEYFLAIVESKSITKAAEKLYVSQPSLSKYLSRLEKNLGIMLFNHKASPLTLTFAGERYYRYIKEVKRMEEQLRCEFEEIEETLRGRVIVGLSPWRASWMLPDILPSFIELYPKIAVEIREGSWNYLEGLMSKDLVDVCIMNLPIGFPKASYEIIVRERILLAINKNSPILKRLNLPTEFVETDIINLSVKEIVGEMVIMLKPDQHMARCVNALFNKENIYPENVFVTESLTMALNLVSRGIGVTFVPEGGVMHRQFPEIMFFTVDKPPLYVEVAAVYRTNSSINLSIRRFIDHIKDFYFFLREI